MDVSVRVSTTLVKCCDICAGIEAGGSRLVKFCAICPGMLRIGRRYAKLPVGVMANVVNPICWTLKPVKKRLAKPWARSPTAPVTSPAIRAWNADWNTAGNANNPVPKSCAAFCKDVEIIWP